MTPDDAMTHVTACICRPGSNGSAVLEVEDICGWEQSTLDTLVSAGALKRLQPATVTTCGECDQRCRRPVVRLPAINGRPVRRFITCPVYDTVAPIPVVPAQLARWRSSLSMLAHCIADALQLPKPNPTNRVGEAYVGQIEGPKGRRKITLVNDGHIILQVGAAKTDLSEIIIWDENGMHVRTDDIFTLAADLQHGSSEKRYERQRIKQAANKLETEKRNQLIFREARRLEQAHPNWNRNRIGVEIAKQPYAVRTSGQRQPLSAKRIVRIMSGKS